MKKSKKIDQQLSPEEMAAAVVFPDTRSKEEREVALNELRKVRKNISKDQTAEDKMLSKILQLKFLMEDYLLQKNLDDDHLYFGYFLKEYIQRLDKKSKDFAEEISVDPTELSQIVNKHRKATEKIIFRLALHSNNIFPALLWFKVLEKDREIELHNNPEIIDGERQFVKKQMPFSGKGL